ncbi:hypothetical protein I6A60_33480 [Frankia sp. AgB1.9]|uniref:hypothetical protein n=1 Tax=unclassified Frankia TaxID=2632575 RepID=UPI00193221FE|nr:MULTISPECIES: hypothetical protein [unclassified Frankia]MBL7489167.1 hypothetical protein [Frankia sp. AgW1.1]MBL7552732.1 hypothetical protein [Frankia sp. AgB1.9]MBL7624639.1 hypothetical protein [Frankia sp. AgB1.8]
MDNLAKLAAAVTEFAAHSTVALVPAVPERDLGPEVNISPGVLDLPGFLSLAASLGGGVLYFEAVAFDPAGGEVADPPAELIKRKGETGRVSVAFAVNGLIHFWEQSAPWYLEWQELAASQSGRFQARRAADEGAERPSDEERARLTAELVSTLLADPGFRAARTGAARQRYAKLALPEGTDNWVGWDACRDAADQAEALAQAQYAQLTPRLDELAAQLLTSREYQEASSAAARKDAAGRFLIPLADGFAAPSLVRDELYARAQRLAKTGKHHPTLL